MFVWKMATVEATKMPSSDNTMSPTSNDNDSKANAGMKMVKMIRSKM